MFKKHLFICNGKTCSQKIDPEKIKKELKDFISENNLTETHRVCTSSCLKRCEEGANMVLYPETVWITHFQESDLAELKKLL